jgi:hypothetical protein
MSDGKPMASIVGSRQIERELSKRGLLPEGCRLIEVSMTPMSALVIRYEVFVRNDQLSLFADALKAAAVEAAADDERNRLALAKDV